MAHDIDLQVSLLIFVAGEQCFCYNFVGIEGHFYMFEGVVCRKIVF